MTSAARRMPVDHGWRVPANDTRTIERRILDALIYIVHTRKQKPKVIYLTKADFALLPVANRRKWEIGGFPVRIGKTSKFYAAGWWGRRI